MIVVVAGDNDGNGCGCDGGNRVDWGMLGTGLNIEPRQQWDYTAYTPRGKARETYCMGSRNCYL